MVVSRVGKEQDIGSQVGKQLFGSPRAFAATAAVIGLLGVIPGMPHLVFLLLAVGMAALARSMHRSEERRKLLPPPPMVTPPEPNAEASWDDLKPVDTLGLEVGFRLIALVDKERQGDLLARIKGVRRKFAQEVGFLPPPVHIRDNLEFKPSAYRLTLRGAVVGEGEAFPGMLLAINPGGATQVLIGTPTTDPAFGLPATWIDESQREPAQMSGFTVVDCSTVVATHLSHSMQINAARLLGRVECQQLVEHVTKLAPKLIEDVVPKMVGIASLQKVLQLLLEEGVHIRDMRSIVECLAEHAAVVTDPHELARRIRVSLAPAIVQQIYGPARELDVIALEPELERLVTQALNSPHGPSLDPAVAETLTQSAARSAKRQEDLGLPACLLVPDAIRAPMAAAAAPRRAAAARAQPCRDSRIAFDPHRLGDRRRRLTPHDPSTFRFHFSTVSQRLPMNVKRYTARTSRDALSLVRQALGDDAVVLSTKPCAEGVEVLAMAPDSLRELEEFSTAAARAAGCRVARPWPAVRPRRRRSPPRCARRRYRLRRGRHRPPKWRRTWRSSR